LLVVRLVAGWKAFQAYHNLSGLPEPGRSETKVAKGQHSLKIVIVIKLSPQLNQLATDFVADEAND
jgi:hypothetical protein